jgi:dGTPase
MPDMSWWAIRHKVVKDVRASSDRDGRSEFERDRSRILHSRAFRRLQAKTQVFPPSKKDFYRTRLTHSLECAQIGKALALRLWKEAREDGGADLVEAACLAHDIGHPPCGHRGEEAIREAGISFDGNAQNVRILTLLEDKVLGSGEESLGLNLTKATLASIMKYPFCEVGRAQEFLYEEDVKRLPLPGLFDESPFRLLHNGDRNEPRPFPLLLMEWADDVAYSTHDTEDGITAGFITPVHLHDDEYRHGITSRVVKKVPSVSPSTVTDRVSQLADGLIRQLEKWADPPARCVKAILDERIDRLVAGVDRRETGNSSDWLYRYELTVPDDVRIECEFLKAVARECVFRDPRVTRLEFKQKKIIGELFSVLAEDCGAREPQLFPRSWWEVIDREKVKGEHAQRRLVADYLSGMSDVYCMQMYALLYDSDSGSAFVTA